MSPITQVLDLLSANDFHTLRAREILDAPSITQEDYNYLWATLDQAQELDVVPRELWDEVCGDMANMAEAYGLQDMPDEDTDAV